MAKRQTIDDHPQDSFIQPLSHNGQETRVMEVEDQAQQPSKQQQKSSKQRITVQISVKVIERVKNAVYWTPGLTLASLAEEAFIKAVDALENKREAPFPKKKR